MRLLVDLYPRGTEFHHQPQIHGTIHLSAYPDTTLSRNVAAQNEPALSIQLLYSLRILINPAQRIHQFHLLDRMALDDHQLRASHQQSQTTGP